MIINNWLGETDTDPAQGQEFINRAFSLLNFVKSVPRFAKVSSGWTHPLHMNFNQLRYGNRMSKALWDTDSVPLAVFLEQNHHIFKAELEAIIHAENGNGYEILRKVD